MSSNASAAIHGHIPRSRTTTETSQAANNENQVHGVTIGSATLYLGDSAEVLPSISSADACVTDPPYGLSYMGKAWDHDVPDADLWQKVLNAVKPGAHLLSFFGSRTYHRGAVQIEEAGFEIRDQIMWLYGSGFPKSHDVSKAIDKTLGAVRDIVGEHVPLGFNRLLAEHGSRTINVTQFARTSERPVTEDAQQWQGWGTALKPAHEPIVLARKPMLRSVARNLMSYGTGALNIDATRVTGNHIGGNDDGPIAGRFPANVIHDGSKAVLSEFPVTRSQRNREPNTAPPLAKCGDSVARFFYAAKASRWDRDEGLDEFEVGHVPYFQTANGTSGKSSPMGKAKSAKRPRANAHPTVKPTDLMRYLCRLVTPPGGVVLDPFMGSGSTGKAAVLEGFRFIGIERDPVYFEYACARIAHAQGIEWKRAA